MLRLVPLTGEQMTERQQEIHDAITSVRSGGRLKGPFSIWLRTPDLAEAADQLGRALRGDGRVPMRLAELAILVTARHWSAEYAWCVHRRHGEAAGLDPTVIDAIAERRRPEFTDGDDAMVYDLANELYESRALSEATYDGTLERLGLETLIELVAICGFYTMIGITLVAFGSPVPDGDTAPFGGVTSVPEV